MPIGYFYFGDLLCLHHQNEPQEWFSLSTHTSSLQLVFDLPNSNKGWANGHVLVSGSWSGLIEGPNQLFNPKRSPELPSIILAHVVSLLLFYMTL